MVKFWKKLRCSDDLKAIDRVTLCLAEFFGTAILMFVGCIGCVAPITQTRIVLENALSFGLAFTMAIQCFGHISGAHVNPILTLGAFISGNLALIEVPIYWIGQFAGSFAGVGLVKLLVPKTSINFGPSHPPVCTFVISSGITPEKGLFLEICISFILVTVSCAIWDRRNFAGWETVPLRFGLIYVVIVLAAGPLTGAQMNPARSLAPAVINNFWKNHWVFWVGPFIGSGLAAILYNTLYGESDKQEAVNELE